jgi:hypothetical protein
MNERIKELATYCIKNSYEMRIGIEDFERFAELIIKECHSVIKSDMELKHIQMIPIDFEMYANNGLGRVIKEHFGVE